MSTNDLSAIEPDQSPLQLPEQRRAPAPMLSPQHIAFARSLPHSRTSTPTPSLLTPPVSGTPQSPPPRHEADDYMNVYGHGHHHFKRQHRKRKSRKTRSTKWDSEDSRASNRSSRAGPQTSNSFKSDCELCAADVSEDDGSNAPLTKAQGWSSLRNHLHDPGKVAEVEVFPAQKSPLLSSSAVDANEIDSPAVNALRSLSFQKPRRSDSQGLRRVSTVFANTFHLFTANPAASVRAGPSHNASKTAEEASSRRSSAHSKSLVDRDINRGPSTFEDRKNVSQTPGIPATITLRKASKIGALSLITTSMSASLAREPEFKRPVDAPASELLAFYSSPTLDKKPILMNVPTPESADIDIPDSQKQQPAHSYDEESQPSRRESKSISPITEILNARRFSTPAEAALTFADVHVAPGSFSVEPKFGEPSLVPAEVSQRISTVQFRSRNSVHEIIWREDETTSESSLTGSSSASQKARHSFRSSPSPQSGGSPTRKPANTEPKETRTILAAVPESVSISMKRPENLFGWTWGASSSAPVNDTVHASGVKSDDSHGQVVEGNTNGATDTRGDPLGQILVISTSDSDLANRQLSSDQSGSRSRRPSFSELLSVLSFPPLRPRSSTAECRKAPLVDLNDPLAGRVSQYHAAQEATTNSGAFSARGGMIRGPLQRKGTAGTERRGSVPRGPARLGSIGSVGSCIGSNAHRRMLARRRS